MGITANHIGLGIDAGGTQTRWALATASGEIVGSGQVNGITALQMGSEAGRVHIQQAIAAIARELPQARRPEAVCAGITGYTENGDSIRAIIAAALALDPASVALRSDIEIVCLDLFALGEGYVVYAGTGTIAAFIDDAGVLHRAGGRGAILDDAGGGFWIAIEALRHIWRNEDTHPGSWRDSPMAVEMFKRIGGSQWGLTREFVYFRERGQIGELALAVGAAAATDSVAHGILQQAGGELARLGNALISRFGPRPIALSGRVAQLHPVIEQSLRAALPPDIDLKARNNEAHLAAARIAAKSTQPD